MADKPIYFYDVNNAPPGGFFCEIHGERVTGRTFVEIEPKVRALMYKYNVTGLPESVIARYMASRIDNPGRYLKGAAVPVARVQPTEAYTNSVPYTKRHVVAFDKIERRLSVCTKCSKHSRDWCPTCAGHPARLKSMFAEKRPSLPVDTVTGVCQCAKAYEMIISSVEYSPEEGIWEGAPKTCWRYNDV